MSLKIPFKFITNVDAHQKWLDILKTAKLTVEKDLGKDPVYNNIRIKQRHVPPQILGRTYVQYCDLINKIYDAYLNNIHLQRAPYMLEIVCVIVKRMCELRRELMFLMVNDYVYVDDALTQLAMTPFDIELKYPTELAIEARPAEMETLLKKMLAESTKRRLAPVVQKATTTSVIGTNENILPESREPSQNTVKTPTLSIHSATPEDSITERVISIQRCERFRQCYMIDHAAKRNRRRTYAVQQEASLAVRVKAAALIQEIYRKFMKFKRERHVQTKRDIFLGLLPEVGRRKYDFEEENRKVYERRRQTRERIQEKYDRFREMEHERLLVYKEPGQADDIVDEIRNWFQEWYYGYGFFPQYPYELEGGTMLVLNGDYPTIEEKLEADEKYLKSIQGKNKEQLKRDAELKKIEAETKAVLAKEEAKKAAEQEFKMKCNPLADPGYQPKKSEYWGDVLEALQKYRATWSIYDDLPPEIYPDALYGYMKTLITEELMAKIHQECRMYVDEMMRLDLKLLIKKHRQQYQKNGLKYPNPILPRKKPKNPPAPKVLVVDEQVLKNLEAVFDLDIITKPSSRIKDIIGDYSFGAYNYNVKDPDAQFKPPSYCDIKRRLLLSCVFGSGLVSGAKRYKSVLLFGPARMGKSFLVDCVAGEMNAIKIDISPERFSAVLSKQPARMMSLVFTAARVFQPAVIYLRNIERVFAKKVPPEQRRLKAASIKKYLVKLLKALPVDTKVIFMATCSDPWSAKVKPMISMFNEVIMVPRTDYNSLRMFFFHKFQSIQSIPPDISMQPLVKLLQGYGIGLIFEIFSQVLTAERIARLNITPLSPYEFLEPLLEMGIEPLSKEEYQEKYVGFYIKNSPLKNPREEFAQINACREKIYKKMASKDQEQKQ